MKSRLTREADEDVARALRSTRRLFGPGQVRNYSKLINDGVDSVAQDPSRPECIKREEFGHGVKSFHLEHVKRRKGSAAHVIYFMEMLGDTATPEIVVIGLMHERMEPKRRLAIALRREEGRLALRDHLSEPDDDVDEEHDGGRHP